MADSGIEKPKLTPRRNPSTPESVAERERSRLDTQTGQQLAGISLEILEAETGRMRPDQVETMRIIESINLREKAEKQKEQLKMLRTVLWGVLHKLYQAGVTKEQAINIRSIKMGEGGVQVQLNQDENAAFNKIKDILGSRGDIGKTVGELWPLIIERDYASFKQVQEAAASMQDGSFEKKKGNAVVDFIKEHPYISAGIAITGAIAAYSVLSHFFGKSDSASGEGGQSGGAKEGLFSRAWHWLIGGTAAIAGVFGVGQLLGSETIQKFFKEQFDIDITNSRITQFIVALSRGDIWEAFRVLLEGPHPYFLMYQKVIDDIKKEQNKIMSCTCLRKFGQEKYKDFLNKTPEAEKTDEQTKQAVAQIAAATGVSIPETLQRFMMIGDSKKEQQEALKKYLLDHKDKITDENVTVNGALALVTGNQEIYNKEKTTPQQDKGPGEKTITVIQTGVEKLTGLGEEIWEDLKKEPVFNKPEFRALCERIKHPWDILSPNWIADFINYCSANGLSIIFHSGKVIVWDTYKFILFTTGDTFYKTALELVQAPFSDEHSLGTSTHAYLVASSPFIFFYGAKAGLALLREPGWKAKLNGFAQNAGRGVLAPVEVVRGHARVGISGQRVVEGWLHKGEVWYKGRKYGIESAEWKQAVQDAIDFHARQIDKYDYFQRRYENTGKLGKLWDRVKSLFSQEEVVRYRNKQIIRLKDILQMVKEKNPALYEELQTSGLNIENMDVRNAPTVAQNIRDYLKRRGIASYEIRRNWLDRLLETTMEQSTVPPGNLSAYDIKVTDIIAFKDGSMFNVDAIGSNGILRGEFIGNSEHAEVQERTIELKDGKIIMRDPAGNIIRGQWEVRATTAQVRVGAVPRTAETAGGAAGEVLAEGGVIESVDYVNEGGKRKIRVKIKGQNEPVDLGPEEGTRFRKAEVLKRIAEELKKNGVSETEIAKLPKILTNTRLLRYWESLHKVLGPAVAAAILYHLHTAEDKKKALAETSIGLGSFMAGMKLTHWKIGSKVAGKDPLNAKRVIAAGVIDFLGGMAAAMGFTEPITEIVDSYVLTFPGAYGASDEVLSAVDKVMGIYGLRTMERIGVWATKKALIRFGEKQGVKVMEKIFITKFENVFAKRLARMAGGKLITRILASLGVRGAVAGGLLADDALVIGVVDDIIAAGLLLWSAKDILDIVIVIRDAVKLNEEMKRRATVPITNYEVKDTKSRAALQKELTKQGKTIDTMMELGEQAVEDIIRGVPEMEIEVVREGMPGREVWIMKGGEIVGMKIKDDSGKVICEVKDKDADKIDKAAQEAEKAKTE